MENINLENVLNLMNSVDIDSDLASNEGSPAPLGRKCKKGTVQEKIETARGFLSSMLNKDPKETDEDKEKSLMTVVNSIVKVVSKVWDTVTEQGKEIRNILEKLTSEKTQRDILLDEIQKRYDELEARTKQDKEDLETKARQTKEELEAQTKHDRDALEVKTNQAIEEVNSLIKENSDEHRKEVEKRIEFLEKQCDEGRQREMKGTLIVSSPGRGRRTEAVIKTVHWSDNDTWGPEADIDMVLRMVHEKTGVRIPFMDVAACHRIGKWESHSFVLKIWNRKPFSAWEFLTEAMLTGKHFSRQNIFINFMLTPRRTEISKQVRKAKVDQKLQKYSIDQNGKIFVKKLGEDKDWYQIFCLDDIEKYAKKD
jgi:hypothetical protein